MPVAGAADRQRRADRRGRGWMVERSCGAGLAGGVEGEVAEPEGFADVVLVHAWVSGEVGDGPRDPQAAMEPAGGEAESVDGGAEETAGGRGGAADEVQLPDREPGVGDSGARCGDLAGDGDTRADGRGGLSLDRRFEVGGGDAVDPHVEVDAVEQGPGQTALVAADLLGTAAALALGIAEIAAPTGVGGRDQLEPGREADAGGGSDHGDLAVLERLAERLAGGTAELGQLVHEQHAVMGEADLARPWDPGPAADQPGDRD